MTISLPEIQTGCDSTSEAFSVNTGDGNLRRKYYSSQQAIPATLLFCSQLQALINSVVSQSLSTEIM